MGRLKTELSVGQTIVLGTYLKEVPSPSYSFNAVLARLILLDENFPLADQYRGCNPVEVIADMKVMAMTIDIVMNNYKQLTREVRKIGAKLEAGQPVMDSWFEIRPLLDRVQQYDEVEDGPERSDCAD